MTKKEIGRTRSRLVCLTCAMAAVALPDIAFAQSVPPVGTEKDAAGGPLGSQTQPGVRPPKSQGRAAVAAPGGQPGTPRLPQAIRWTEDWSAPPASNASLLDKIKHIPLGSDLSYLTLGGEIRTYYTAWDHQNAGLRANDANDPLQLRLRLLADLHVGPYVRAFVELGDNREFGARLITPPNRGPLDIEQAFVDLTVPLGDGKLTVRPGRFEMPLGNGKLVTIRDGVNQRVLQQGVRATYILPGKISVDTFAVRPVQIYGRIFNNGPAHDQTFNGVYVSTPKGPAGVGIDAYWFRLNRGTALNAQGVAKESRNSWGARAWKRTRTVDFDLEGTYQSGTFGAKKISAWAVMLDTGYSFLAVAMAPRLGIKANIFSGDGDRSDGTVGTFVAPFPRYQMLNAGVLFNYSNMMNINPSLTLKPAKTITLVSGAQFYWRNREDDGVYIGPVGASFAPYAGSKFTGAAMEVDVSWQATKNLQFGLQDSYFMPSRSLSTRGGAYGNYFGLYSSVRF
ncbi:alginate export family protein [Sphingomonas sp. LB3N6]|uniref:alginate export family protein n=1 Tax=Sphingomonas fucosidasi TaxID=3096164 RepID=UPI002FCCB187